MSIRFHTRLTIHEQTDAGVLEPAALAFADRVHHDDLDALLHVNNVRYFVWFERLRVRFMQDYAIGTIGDPQSPRIVVRSAEVRYLQEMVRDEVYIITTRCTAMRRTSLTLHQAIWSGGTKRATLDCVMVLLTQDGKNRAPIPEEIKARLRQTDGAVDQSP
jgi:acyl-CoA thioester hydrolase